MKRKRAEASRPISSVITCSRACSSRPIVAHGLRRPAARLRWGRLWTESGEVAWHGSPVTPSTVSSSRSRVRLQMPELVGGAALHRQARPVRLQRRSQEAGSSCFRVRQTNGHSLCDRLVYQGLYCVCHVDQLHTLHESDWSELKEELAKCFIGKRRRARRVDFRPIGINQTRNPHPGARN